MDEGNGKISDRPPYEALSTGMVPSFEARFNEHISGEHVSTSMFQWARWAAQS